jgi:hypothetical protein
LRSASAQTLRRPPEKSAVADSRPAAYQLDAHRRERIEIKRGSLGGSDKLRRREPSRTLDVLDLVIPFVPHARGVHPPQDIPPAVRARQAEVLGNRERHRPHGSSQLGRQLHGGRRRSHDEHAAVGEPGRAAVAQRRQLLDVRRNRGREARHRRAVVGPAGEDDRTGRISPWLVAGVGLATDLFGACRSQADGVRS